jgi:hypothetical protein
VPPREGRGFKREWAEDARGLGGSRDGPPAILPRVVVRERVGRMYVVYQPVTPSAVRVFWFR